MTPSADGPTTLSPARTRFALLALALGGFGIGLSEFVAMGLLPFLASDLLPELSASDNDQALAQAGWLISAYAFGVVVGAPTVAAFSARFPRKQLLMVLVAFFVGGTILSASLPTFELVLAARFLTALPHGAYFGVAALVAAELMGPGNRGRGVAFVLGGLTISNVVGVPFVTWLGQVSGWRASYFVVAGVFAATFFAIWLAVPLQAGDRNATMRNELKAFTKLQVWMALAIGAIGFGGLFAVYTYISPLVTEVTGLPLSVVPIALIVVGIGMTVGNFFGGWYADRGIARSVIVFFIAMFVALAGLIVLADTTVGLFVFLFLVGAAAAALSPAIQVRLMDVAGDSKTIAAAVNHASLNLGNALGAFLGGVTIAAGFGFLSPAWVGLVMTVSGLVIALISFGIDRVRDHGPSGGVPTTENPIISPVGS